MSKLYQESSGVQLILSATLLLWIIAGFGIVGAFTWGHGGVLLGLFVSVAAALFAVPVLVCAIISRRRRKLDRVETKWIDIALGGLGILFLCTFVMTIWLGRFIW